MPCIPLSGQSKPQREEGRGNERNERNTGKKGEVEEREEGGGRGSDHQT